MRKTLGLMLLLLAVSLGGVCFAGASINSQRDQVTFAVNILAGDEAAAEGLVVETKAQCDDRLFWDTVYTPGAENALNTAYTVSGTPLSDQEGGQQAAVSLSNDLVWEWLRLDIPGEAATGLGRAYEELIGGVAPGETKTEHIHLKDYYAFYPIQAALSLPGCSLNTAYLPWASGDGNEGLEALDRAFAVFFKIPVVDGGPRDERYNLHLQKDRDGNGSRSGIERLSGDFFSFSTWSVTLADACYFVFDAHTNDGNLVNTSQMGGDFGIYRLPYELDEEGTATVDPEGLATAYPLDPSVSILGLYADLPRERLLLLTAEDGLCVLTVIDGAAMETVQRLEAAELSQDGWVDYVCWQEDFMVLELSGKRLVLITPAEGGYALRFAAELEEDSPLRPVESIPSAAWDGERLALAGRLSREDGRYQECGFYLLVYDSAGQVLYRGEYPSSLSVGNVEPYDNSVLSQAAQAEWSVYEAILKNSYRYYAAKLNCTPWGYAPVTVRWDG